MSRKAKALKFVSELLQLTKKPIELNICKSTSLQKVFDLIKLKIQKEWKLAFLKYYYVA